MQIFSELNLIRNVRNAQAGGGSSVRKSAAETNAPENARRQPAEIEFSDTKTGEGFTKDCYQKILHTQPKNEMK
jgi:hypothetical protein